MVLLAVTPKLNRTPDSGSHCTLTSTAEFDDEWSTDKDGYDRTCKSTVAVFCFDFQPKFAFAFAKTTSAPTPIGMLTRDPIEYHDGPSRYATYFASQRMDPSGLYSLTDAVDSLCNQQITCYPCPEQTFEEWLRLERSHRDLWKDLPKCPCSLWITDSGLIPCGAKRAWRPNPTDWEQPGVPSIPEATLHPGAKYSMRSKSVDGHSNQCTYDENGNLFIEPPTAGSVDNNTPGTFGHVGNDVDPAGLANTIDGGCHVSWWNPFAPCVVQIPAGQHVLDYYSVRPSWHDNCPKK